MDEKNPDEALENVNLTSGDIKQFEVAQQLIVERGAKISADLSNTWTLFIHAIYQKRNETAEGREFKNNFAKLLLDRALHIDAQLAPENNTPLMLAAHANNKAIMEYLLSRGDNINATNPDGKTALHFATEINSTEMIEYLVANGAEINAADRRKKTALHFAMKHKDKHPETSKCLIALGADVNATDDLGRKPGHTNRHISFHTPSSPEEAKKTAGDNRKKRLEGSRE